MRFPIQTNDPAFHHHDYILFFLQRPDQPLLSPEPVPPVNQIYLPAVATQKQGILQSRIAAACDSRIFSPVKRPVAGGAVGNTRPGQFLLSLKPQPAFFRSGRQYDCPAGIAGTVRDHGFLSSFFPYLHSLFISQLRPKLCRLPVQIFRKFIAGYPADPRIVLHFHRRENLSAVYLLFQKKHPLPGANSIDGCRQSRRSGSNNNEIIHVVFLQIMSYSLSLCPVLFRSISRNLTAPKNAPPAYQKACSIKSPGFPDTYVS